MTPLRPCLKTFFAWFRFVQYYFEKKEVMFLLENPVYLLAI